MYKFLVVVIVALPFYLSAQEYHSKWQTQPIINDGNLSEWDERPGHFDAKSNVLYGYRNDSTNLYLAVEIADKAMQMKAISIGFKIELTVKSKPKTNATLSFPLQQKNTDQQSQQTNRPDPKELQRDYKLQNAPALAEGFKTTKGTISPNKVDDNNLRYGVDWDKQNAMVFELIIPLTELFESDNTIDKMTETDIVMELNFAAAQRPTNQMQGGMGMQPGGGGRGNGGPPGGGMSGGQHPSGGMQNQQGDMQSSRMLMYSEQNIKCKFNLVFKKHCQ